MAKVTKTIQEQLSTIPSYTEIPEGVFRDINHYKKVLTNITKALARGRGQSKSRNSDGSYLFDGIEVEFDSKIDNEQIYLDYHRSKIVLKAPKVSRESKDVKRKRIMYYHGELLKSVEAMKTIGITTIFLVISESGRKKLEKLK